MITPKVEFQCWSIGSQSRRYSAECPVPQINWCFLFILATDQKVYMPIVTVSYLKFYLMIGSIHWYPRSESIELLVVSVEAHHLLASYMFYASKHFLLLWKRWEIMKIFQQLEPNIEHWAIAFLFFSPAGTGPTLSFPLFSFLIGLNARDRPN